MDRKKLITTLATIMILFTLITPMLYLPTARAADPSDWYTTLNGVLTTDSYLLYPYAEQSVDIGLSKYGEMINGSDPSPDVGLQYPGYDAVGTYDQMADTSRDPFANEYIDKELWLNGWVCDVRYTHRTWDDRRVLTMAMFADMTGYGGDWINGHGYTTAGGHTYNLALAPHGGRKSTGIATTEPLMVLYDGPRRYIALSNTTIYDWEDTNANEIVDEEDASWPILRIRLTFIFNKVKKQVIILKDIKILISGKELLSPLDVQFSNREEWDLGPPPNADESYAHFWHQNMTTCYGREWHMAPALMREYIVEGTPIGSVPVQDGWWGAPIVPYSVRLYYNGEYMEEGVDYIINHATGAITGITFSIGSGDHIKVVYKLVKEGTIDFVSYEDGQITELIWGGIEHNYDVAQIISGDLAYVGWKAFWPTLSDYTVDGWARSLEPLIDVEQPDIVPSEPEIPFVIGEWDFMLGKQYPLQFRGVEVVGLTDYHDAEDANIGIEWENVIDREAQYQLDEVFNPWGLRDAIHKPSARWVEFVDITVAGSTFTTDMENVPVIVRPDSEWDAYSVFSERIVNEDTGELLLRGVDYDIVQNSVGTATITFYETGYMKVLYSTMGMYMTTEDNANNATVYGVADGDMDTYVFGDDAEAPIEFYIVTPTPTQTSKTATLKIRADDLDVTSEVDAVYLNGYLAGILHGDDETWVISEFEVPGWYLDSSGMQLVQIFVSCDMSVPLPVWINTTDSTTWPNVTSSWATTVDWGSIVFNYAEYIPMPRYEWVVVGRDAASVDSIGAAFVSAAFKDKQVEIGMTGVDMLDPELANQIPYVMSKHGTGDAMTDYHFDHAAGDHRAGLRQDWCTTWPVASSDMIGVGGPLANVYSYYMNDFTEAYFDDGVIETSTCWNKNSYASNASLGYAVIGTYKDINGTVNLVVWGHWGRDTYYASKWFKEIGIFQLQEAPEHLTGIVLEIDYTVHEPSVSIVECLGTISETEWIHGLEIKGGIHDP